DQDHVPGAASRCWRATGHDMRPSALTRRELVEKGALRSSLTRFRRSRRHATSTVEAECSPSAGLKADTVVSSGRLAKASAALSTSESGMWALIARNIIWAL